MTLYKISEELGAYSTWLSRVKTKHLEWYNYMLELGNGDIRIGADNYLYRAEQLPEKIERAIEYIKDNSKFSTFFSNNRDKMPYKNANVMRVELYRATKSKMNIMPYKTYIKLNVIVEIFEEWKNFEEWRTTMNDKALAVAHILDTILNDYEGNSAFLIRLKKEAEKYTLMRFKSDVDNYAKVTSDTIVLFVYMIEDIKNMLETDEDTIKFCRKLLALVPKGSITKIDYAAMEKEAKMNNITAIINEKLSTLE